MTSTTTSRPGRMHARRWWLGLCLAALVVPGSAVAYEEEPAPAPPPRPAPRGPAPPVPSLPERTLQFGQGLLTYSLLKGMRGAKLRGGTHVNVAELFEFAADEVPMLAAHIGGVQRPQLTSPRLGSSFDIGSLPTQADRARAPFRMPKQFVARAQLHDGTLDDDRLDLSTQVDRLLREASSTGKEAPWVFVDVRRFPGAYRISGSYTMTAAGLAVRWRLWQDALTDVPTPIETVTAADDAAAEIVRRLRDVLPEPE